MRDRSFGEAFGEAVSEAFSDAGALADPLHLAWTRHAARRKLFGATVRPLTLGRYELVRPLGAGGMGIVFLAHDPALQRPVAIKLARLGAHDDTLAWREARALASLSHPNVLPIFEVGRADDGRLYLVLEFVEGMTLDQWLQDAAPAPHDVVKVLDAAAAGLEAAHRAGLVHRDFKPSNVLLAPEGSRDAASGQPQRSRDAARSSSFPPNIGRVLVADFGLAAFDRTDDAEARAPNAQYASVMTCHGATLRAAGTLAYMAPEQHLAAPVDARADQYSFCVVLYEALYGRRPFTADDPESLLAAKRSGRVPPPRDSRRLFEVLARGLAPHPADRYASMEALRRALAQCTRRSPRRAVIGVGLASLAVGAALIVPASGSDTCDLADFGRSHHRWPTAAALSSAASASEAWNLRARLDTHQSEWRHVARELCELPMTPEAETRRGCAVRQRAELDALLELLISDASISAHDTAEAIARLEQPSRCLLAEVEELSAMPSTPERAHILALEHVGNKREALTAAGEALAQARMRGDVRLVDRMRLTRARLQAELGRGSDAAAREQQEVYWSAMARRDDVLAAEAALQLLATTDADQFDGMLRFWKRESVARLAALPVAVALRTKLLVTLCVLEGARQAYTEAEQLCTAALEQFQRHPELDRADAAPVLVRLAEVVGALGDHEAAARHAQQAVDLLEREVGPTHPNVGAALGSLAQWTALIGEPEAALIRASEAMAIFERAFGDSTPQIVPLLAFVAAAHEEIGDYQQAREAYARALQIQTRHHGEAHPYVGDLHVDLGNVARHLGNSDEARTSLHRGLVSLETSSGADSIAAARAHYHLGLLERDVGRLHDALAHFKTSAAVCRLRLGEGHPACVDAAREEHGVRRALKI